MSEGKELRKKILALRDSLSDGELTEKSSKISEKILGFKEIEMARNIFIYVNFRSEVITLSLISELMKLNKRISVPKTNSQENRIDAIHIEDLSADLVPGYADIPEPRSDLLTENITEPQNIDIVILPGSVFDERGGRFGYGGGYYDRFVEKIPFAVRIGLAFDIQVVKEAPLQPHDELLDYIVTENRIIEVDSRL
ncbi:MAG: 5-formyltetrahydrofolate cyclo-ligase [Desulfocapsaceae bacterium]|nr:5-formyltetrahydrofolate cyclo-ligase [Desulfocapsaceae bacterium]